MTYYHYKFFDIPHTSKMETKELTFSSDFNESIEKDIDNRIKKKQLQ